MLLLLTLPGCTENELNTIKSGYGIGDPRILVEPAAIDYGFAAADEVVSRTLTITSAGDSALEVAAMGISAGSWAFSILETATGTLEPGDTSEISVIYTSSGTEAGGELQVVSNDPEQPVVSVPLTADAQGGDDTGETGDPMSQPDANCYVTPDEVLAIHESAAWMGEDSVDTDSGTIVEYRWSLASAPAGSTATMPGGGANRRGFTPDVAGEYVGQLVVVDDDGIESEPCTATLTATAGEGLWIEMFWTRSGDDMDLHLVNGSGTLTSNQDCYYGNCTYGGLDWGTRGNASDNPVLDLDDIAGVGPENINIEDPANGDFTVYVHDYPGSVYSGRNDVTLNIYIGGVLTWTDTRNINSEGCYEPFAEIQIPSGAVSDLAGSCR
jgi:hypothetical protein